MSETSTGVKICGIKDPENLQAACDAGARFIGFVFYPPSPRHISFDIAWSLAQAVPTGVRSVGLFVDPSNEQLDQIVSGIPLDMIQLHGDESPARVSEIKNRFKMPIMKAIRIATPGDLDAVEAYEAEADWLLFDTKAESAPGGTGESFDWSILKNKNFQKPWMLSGGLNAGNVGDALSMIKPDAVDISSGVESQRGQKDSAKIKAFIEKVNAS